MIHYLALFTSRLVALFGTTQPIYRFIGLFSFVWMFGWPSNRSVLRTDLATIIVSQATQTEREAPWEERRAARTPEGRANPVPTRHRRAEGPSLALRRRLPVAGEEAPASRHAFTSAISDVSGIIFELKVEAGGLPPRNTRFHLLMLSGIDPVRIENTHSRLCT